MLINDRAHGVVDKACETLTRWPHDFIGQEDLVMLIHEAVEAAVEEERERLQNEITRLRDALAVYASRDNWCRHRFDDGGSSDPWVIAESALANKTTNIGGKVRPV